MSSFSEFDAPRHGHELKETKFLFRDISKEESHVVIGFRPRTWQKTTHAIDHRNTRQKFQHRHVEGFRSMLHAGKLINI